MTNAPIQPCLDPRCPIHARGAEPDAAALPCARQILRAHDRADAIALLEQELPPSCVGGHRAVIPLAPLHLAVGESGRMTPAASPQGVRRFHRFRPERILLGSGRDLACWRVDDVVLDGRSQIAPHHRLPAELFGSRFLGHGVCAFDRIWDRAGIEVAVTRVRPGSEDVLVGAVVGTATYEPRVLSMRTASRIRGGAPLEIAEVCTRPIEVHRLVIEDAADWMIHDIAVNLASKFSQPGGLPGGLPGGVFSADSVDAFANFGILHDGVRVAIRASYVGSDPEGRPFVAEFRGQEPA